MARCPHCKAKIRKKSEAKSAAGHKLIAWRKANGKLNMGLPPKYDWVKEMAERPELFQEPKKAADHYKVSLSCIYRLIKEKNFKYTYRYKAYEVKNAN